MGASRHRSNSWNLVAATIGSTLYTRDGCSAALGKRQASVCLPAILFKTPLSVPKDSIVNVNFLPLPHPNTEQLQILMYSCACLAEHCIACMFCEICFQFGFFSF